VTPSTLPARPGPMVDTNTPLTKAVCEALVARGILTVGRYVPFAGLSRAGCITAAEADIITGAGLHLLLVSHVRGTPEANFHWSPSAHSGAADAGAAVGCAADAGYPSGAHLFLDLEGISDGPAQTATYAIEWQRAVMASGYRSGLYDGFDCPLDAHAKWLLPGDCYWAAPGHRSVDQRGYAIVQGVEATIAGVAFDFDAIKADQLGGLPFVSGAALEAA
jgi:Domain of unknown function (DUF1906)